MSIKSESLFSLLESSLNGSIARQNVIAHNVSNINTPGFKRFLVDFEQQLQSDGHIYGRLPLRTTREKHIGLPLREDFAVRRDLASPLRADGNNVDLENEMNLMVKNDIYFNAVLNQLNKKIAVLKYVISDGRG